MLQQEILSGCKKVAYRLCKCVFKLACGRSKGVFNCGTFSIFSATFVEVRCGSRNNIKSILEDIRGQMLYGFRDRGR